MITEVGDRPDVSSKPFDQLSKQLFEELLQPYGSVEISREVPGEARQIDIYFNPSPNPSPDPKTLGLLGRMVEFPCLLEPYRNPPSFAEVESCLLKRLWLVSQMRRQGQLLLEQTPRLWIIASTLSDKRLQQIGAIPDPNWPPGIYWQSQMIPMAIVVVHRLPVVPDTLWLRLLGKGKVQQQAPRQTSGGSRD